MKPTHIIVNCSSRLTIGALYEKELQRVWPITEENRKAKIAQFAEKHGFRLAYYKQGLCAIFVEDTTSHEVARPILPSG